jgi:hypothetical protein
VNERKPPRAPPTADSDGRAEKPLNSTEMRSTALHSDCAQQRSASSSPRSCNECVCHLSLTTKTPAGPNVVRREEPMMQGVVWVYDVLTGWPHN